MAEPVQQRAIMYLALLRHLCRLNTSLRATLKLVGCCCRADARVLPLDTSGGSPAAPFIPQASSGIPAAAAATQFASGATQGRTSSINLLGSASSIDPLPATATPGQIAQGPNGQISLQPATLAPSQPQSSNGGKNPASFLKTTFTVRAITCSILTCGHSS